MSNPLVQLHALGQSFWWDSLSRSVIDNGELARMRDADGMRGITSNPSIFHAAISEGDVYDERIAARVREKLSTEQLFWALAVDDIQDACDLLRPVYDGSEARDGFVSLEVNPHLAFDAAGTLRQARELWQRVSRPNLMIKIPGTAQCVPAIRQAVEAGLNINVTLLFAQSAHIAVMDAYLDAIESRIANGLSVDRISSVASFFVSRVDTLIDARLDKLASPEAQALRGKAGIANAQLAYANFRRRFSGPRWEPLRKAGAQPQRPLWASTSTKDPQYSPVLYVEALIGSDTVNTMPTATLNAYRSSGQPRAGTIEQDLVAAQSSLDGLRRLGIDMDEVTATLLREGVEKFNQSFDALLSDLAQKAQRIAAG